MKNECQMSLFLMYLSNNYQLKAEPPLKERIANKLVELYDLDINKKNLQLLLQIKIYNKYLTRKRGGMAMCCGLG